MQGMKMSFVLLLCDSESVKMVAVSQLLTKTDSGKLKVFSSYDPCQAKHINCTPSLPFFGLKWLGQPAPVSRIASVGHWDKQLGRCHKCRPLRLTHSVI